MKTKKLTVKEYADLRKISPSGVRKAITRGHRLPGVVKVGRFGKSYQLRVGVTVNEEGEVSLEVKGKI